ncbi:MAG: extracellular solute-binding protein [Burkholderiales bacterium]|nr:extracellular solute-binding protein [Burkholderiales bacterium]MDE2274740.1 extracellular solute-binding protein [Burkholderiales bacterium]
MTAPSAARRAWLAVGLGAALPVRAGARRTLSVAAYPLVDEIVKAALPRWRQRHPDVHVEVVSRQYADHHTAMTTALSTSVYLPDVMALESSYVGRFSQGTGLGDLSQPPYRADLLRERFVPFAYDQTVNSRGEVTAVPTDIGPGTLLYREDLLAKAGLTAADLAPSWDAYVEAGIRLKAATGAYLIGNAQTLKDIVMRTGIRPGEGMYFDRDSRVLVQEPRFVRAFELARKLRRHGLDARVNAWSNEWAEGFRRGTLATELSGAWMVGQMANWVAPDTRGRWRAAQLPESTFVSYGGTFYAMPRRAAAENKALAWELIELLTLDRRQQLAAFKDQDAFPALLEAFDDPFFAEPMPFLGGEPARRLWRDAARRITARRVHKQDNFADEVVSTELDNVLDHDKPIEQALADAYRLLEHRAHR